MRALPADDMPDPERPSSLRRADVHGRNEDHRRDEPLPPWIIPPAEGFRAEDLDHLPQLPSHAELIDGRIVLVSPQSFFHMLTVSLLEGALRLQVPEGLRVSREMTVTLADRQRPELDILVVDAKGVTGRDQTSFKPEHVVIAVEVVSQESEIRDRERKPQLYAEAGIPHFWRVENSDGRPMVCVFELDAGTRKYVATGIHHDRLKLTVPFDIDIDLTEIDRL
ncbi:Uma2 family endonuclease [Actinomadura spongiicola]|nr:Uma2 family endonuclease [Actinomadura spongiicola]